MKCNICTRPDVKEINLVLLSRQGRRTGIFTAMARKLGVARQTLWRHRKEHLRIDVSREAPKRKNLTFEERVAMLESEADRLQAQAENGAPKEVVEQALKALGIRMKLLQLEARLSGRLRGGTSGRDGDLDAAMRAASVLAAGERDPEEEARTLKEFEEVCGAET